MFPRRYTDEQKMIVREHYPNMSTKEIRINYLPELTDGEIRYLVKVTGVEHTEETKERIKRIQTANCRFASTPEARARSVKSRNETVRKEMLRRKYGLGQKTKLRFSDFPRGSLQARAYLVRTYGYIRTTDDWTLWYDKSTRRRTETETYYHDRYRFVFEKAED